LDNIKQKINHSKDGEVINPKTLINHLEIHLNELKVTAGDKTKTMELAMLTKEDTRCKSGSHNPFSTSHMKENCWMIYPDKREAFLKQTQGSSNSNISSFSTFSSSHINIFILDSGSTSHMISDKNLFINLDKTKKGVINTSCGPNSLKIEGRGSVTLSYKRKPIVLHNVLYVP
jgi:hypothetical protein